MRRMPEWGVHGPVTVEGAPCGVSIRSRLSRMCGAPPRSCPLSSARTRGDLPFHTPPQFKKIGAFQHVGNLLQDNIRAAMSRLVLPHAWEPAVPARCESAASRGSLTCAGTLPIPVHIACPKSGLSHMPGNLAHANPDCFSRPQGFPACAGTRRPRTPQPQSMLPSSGEARGESCGVSACPQDARSTSAIRATAFSVKRFRALARRAPSSRSASRPSE